MPRKRADWSEKSLRDAMAAVKYGQLSQLAAARRYKIPRQTLRNHLISGQTIKRLGRTAVLSLKEEVELVQRITKLALTGTTLSPTLIQRQAFLFCEEKKIKHSFNKCLGHAGSKWLKAFLMRHPQLRQAAQY